MSMRIVTENGTVTVVEVPLFEDVSSIEETGTHSIMNKMTGDLSGGSIVDQYNKFSEDPHPAGTIRDFVETQSSAAPDEEDPTE